MAEESEVIKKVTKRLSVNRKLLMGACFAAGIWHSGNPYMDKYISEGPGFSPKHQKVKGWQRDEQGHKVR